MSLSSSCNFSSSDFSEVLLPGLFSVVEVCSETSVGLGALCEPSALLSSVGSFGGSGFLVGLVLCGAGSLGVLLAEKACLVVLSCPGSSFELSGGAFSEYFLRGTMCNLTSLDSMDSGVSVSVCFIDVSCVLS